MMAVLSPYPLSRQSAARLQTSVQTEYLTLSELRLQPPRQMLGKLRALRSEQLRIVLQEDSERAVLPLMLTLAALTKARALHVDNLVDGSTRQVGRLRALLGGLGIVAATLSGRWTIHRLGTLSRRLLAEAPLSFPPLSAAKALYLKTNLMLGAKAGGSIGHIAGVANELVRRAPQSLVLAPELPPLVSPQARFGEVPALQTYGFPPEANHFRFNGRCMPVAREALRKERFDFIYQRLTLGNLAGVLLSRQFKIPLVLEYNGSEVWVSQNWGHKLRFAALAESIEQVCLRHAHRVVTVSEVLADELISRGVPRERIVWYPNCIDPEMFDPARHQPRRQELRARYGIAVDELVVLFIGTFGQWHGAETLAEAARLVLARSASQGPRLRFVFVGDGLRLTAVRKLLKAETEVGDVIFTGLVLQHEAPAYLAMADIFSSPHVPSKDGSKFFGSPTKLFEYMAMARPIVASRLDQLADVLQPAVHLEQMDGDWIPTGEETALLVEPGSAEAIADALLRLQANPELRVALSQAARRKALRKYTWRRHVDVIMDSLR
jgi:glycosyltransferase involved in cell wall biosynthesis